MLGQPFIGANALLQGLKLIATPGLRRFVAIPLAVNVLLFTVSIWVLERQFSPLVNRWVNALPDWLHWLEWLFWLIFAITAVLLVFYTFSLLANLVASPFNSLLAEAVEKHLTGQPLPSSSSLITVLKDLPVALFDELRKIGYYLLIAIPLLILSWIVTPIPWIIFSAWMMTVQYCDYPMGNHGLLFAEQRRRLRQRKLLSLGFGGTTLLATMVPIFNFLVMPAAVAGATSLWVKQLAEK